MLTTCPLWSMSPTASGRTRKAPLVETWVVVTRTTTRPDIGPPLGTISLNPGGGGPSVMNRETDEASSASTFQNTVPGLEIGLPTSWAMVTWRTRSPGQVRTTSPSSEDDPVPITAIGGPGSPMTAHMLRKATDVSATAARPPLTPSSRSIRLRSRPTTRIRSRTGRPRSLPTRSMRSHTTGWSIAPGSPTDRHASSRAGIRPG